MNAKYKKHSLLAVTTEDDFCLKMFKVYISQLQCIFYIAHIFMSLAKLNKQFDIENGH